MGYTGNSLGSIKTNSKEIDSVNYSLSNDASLKGKVKGQVIEGHSLEENAHYGGQESAPEEIAIEDFMPSPPQNETGDSSSAPFNPADQEGGYNPGVQIHVEEIDFKSVSEMRENGEEIPDLSGFNLEPVECGTSDDGETIAFKDENENVFYAKKVNDSWQVTMVENIDGEVLNLADEDVAYIIQAILANGLTIEDIEFSEENNFVYIYTDHGDFLFDYGLKRCKFIGNEDEEYFRTHDMYSVFGVLTSQYGGYQGYLNFFYNEYMHDETIYQIIEKYFPGEEITAEQLELLFARMRRVGCGYIACINTIFEYLENISDEEWMSLFGFPRTTEDGQYNYQYLFLEFFLYYQEQLNHYDSMDNLLGNEDNLPDQDSSFDIPISDLEGATGLDTDYFIDIFINFLKQYHLTAEIPKYTNEDNYQEAVEQAIASGNQVFLGTDDTPIYYPFDTNGDGELNDVYVDDTEAHAFTIVDIAEDGRWVVSTWGRMFLMDPNEIPEDAILEVYPILYQ